MCAHAFETHVGAFVGEDDVQSGMLCPQTRDEFGGIDASQRASGDEYGGFRAGDQMRDLANARARTDSDGDAAGTKCCAESRMEYSGVGKQHGNMSVPLTS